MYSDDDDDYIWAHGYSDDDPYYDDFGDYCDDSDNEYRVVLRMPEHAIQDLEEKDLFQEDTPTTYQPMTLLDVCCKYLALNFPFAYLQDRFPPVPDDLQLRVISFSFPDSVEKIRKYAQFSKSDINMVHPARLCDRGKVKEMMQIGFRLSACVDGKYVTIHFDRGKITSANCSCSATSSWCNHVIATAMMRIQQAGKLDKSQTRLPVSDALNTLSHEQLLKFSHYLLYHHQNHKIVETAQDLIDKLVNLHGNHNDEEINVVSGVPDPTAGPGLDEECHWLLCKKSFKEICRNSLTNEPTANWGFAVLEEVQGNTNTWFSNTQQPLFQDEIDHCIREEHGYHRYAGRSGRENSSKILETVLEVLKDDSTSGLFAMKSCTELVLEHLAKQRSPSSSSSTHQVQLYPSCSTAMGFTARPFRSWTLSDELARLWQMAVLNPKLKHKEREHVGQELLKWNKEAHASCIRGQLKPWKGLEVAYNLCQQINWDKPDMQAVLKGTFPTHCSISGCTLVEVNLAEASLSCHLPYCFSYGSLSLDIHSWCSVITSLEAYNYCSPAVNIACSLALALISLYRYHADTRVYMSAIPIIAKCILEHDRQKEDAEVEASTAMDVDNNGEFSWLMIWPSDTLVSVRCVAFLYNYLSSKQSCVESLLDSRRQQDPSGTTELGAALNNISDSQSLLFQLGVVGLVLPKFPMATSRQEEEQYDLENWLTSQLLSTKTPRKNDLEFLKHFCKITLNGNPSWPLAPCSSFTRVALQHLVKEFSVVTKDVFELVLQSLNQDLQGCPWTLFEFSIGMTWSKLAELSLSTFVGENSPYLEHALNSILSDKGVLGQGGLKMRILSDSPAMVRQLQGTLERKSVIAFALAKALHSRAKLLLSSGSYECTTDVELLPLKSNPIMGLRKCAIHIAVHCVFLVRSLDHNSRTHGSAVRWLIESSVEYGLSGIRCLIDSHSDIMDFLKHDGAIDLCRTLLRKNEVTFLDSVKEVLVSLLRHAISTDEGDLVGDIFQMCRQNDRNVRDDLIPWACQQFRDMTLKVTGNFNSRMTASQELFRFYKEMLIGRIRESQHLEGFGLQRRFSEGTGDDEEACKPSPRPNPYMTQSPHPYLELAFELGVMGLQVVPKEENAQLRRRGGVKDGLKKLCELVCYITTRKWLKAEQIANKPYETNREESESQVVLDPNVLGNDSYIKHFITELLKADIGPMILMDIFSELANQLGTVNSDWDRQTHRELHQNLLGSVVTFVPNVHLLLQSIQSKFANLLLGQKVTDLITRFTGQRRGSPRDLLMGLKYLTLEENSLVDTLQAAKKAFGVSDPSGSRFKNLTEEMAKKHSVLKPLFEEVLSDEDHTEDQVSRVPFELFQFMAAQELIRRHCLQDFF